ncbi:S8 family serine peptidase [Dyella jejuensis]|uniref:S8 family serine peptidase n=1 Tax=Dyella jejuensis TaxID=1432009 RepID=A0ABW8JPG2_9GAMM
MKPFPSIRISAIVAALAVAIPTAQAADASALPAPKALARLSVATEANQTYNRFIVTYRDGTSERSNRNNAVQNINAAIGRAGLGRATISSTGATIAPLQASYQRKLAIGADLIRTSRALNQSEANSLMRQIAADPAVAHVQPDFKMHAVRDIAAPADLQARAQAAMQAFTPDDPNYAQYQWDYWDATGGANTNNAWELADGTGVTVAVIDTGITQHPDLDLSLADEGYDFISDAYVSGRDTDDRAPGGWDLGDWTTTEPYLSDTTCVSADNPAEPSSWHGTHVAGTVAELTNNGIGMAGTAYNAKVLPLRALGHCGGYTSDIVDAIEWASGGHVEGVPDNTHVAQVINMSLGSGDACTANDATGVAVADALGRGTTVVVAAGNSGADVANFSPASCPGVIAVASSGITGKRAFYSNYGAGVTLAAPGGGIYANDASSGQQVNEGFVWSAINDGDTTPENPTYGGYAGTSQATPHVAGTVALMLSAAQAAGLAAPSPADIKNMLVGSARPFPVAEDHPIGAGIVDAAAAVNAALGNDSGNPDDGANAIALTNGVILPGQSAGYNGSILYSIVVPAGATTLNIRSLGGSGDTTLYVKAGSAPSADGSNADFVSAKPGNNEAVVIPKPQAATYYILLAAKKADTQVYNFTNVSVLAAYKP